MNNTSWLNRAGYSMRAMVGREAAYYALVSVSIAGYLFFLCILGVAGY